MPAAWRLVEAGERSAAAGDLASARERFRSAHAEAPKDHRVLLCHAMAIGDRDPAGAVNLCIQAAQIAPRLASTHAVCAWFSLLASRYPAAVRSSSKAVELDALNPLAHTVWALAQAGTGHWEAALRRLYANGVFESAPVAAVVTLRLMRRWRELGPVWPPLPKEYQEPEVPNSQGTSPTRPAAASVGKRLYRAYLRCDGATMLAALGVLRAASPESPDIAPGYAAALYFCGRSDLAEPWVRRALREQRKAAKREWERGLDRIVARAWRRLRRLPRPVRADDEHEPSGEALLLAAKIGLSLGDLSRARGYAERASRLINPFDRWEARLVLAEVHDREGRTAEALSGIRAAIREEPSVVQLILHRVFFHSVLTAARDAIVSAEQAGDARLAGALRAAMAGILTDPRRPGRSRLLRRLLVATKAELLEPTRAALLEFATTGMPPGGRG